MWPCRETWKPIITLRYRWDTTSDWGYTSGWSPPPQHPPPEEPHQEETLEAVEFSEMLDTLYSDIIVIFHKYRTAPLKEHMKLQKFDWSGDGNKRLKAAKEAIQRIRQNINGPLSVNYYNTLLYATALTLAGQYPILHQQKTQSTYQSHWLKNTTELAYCK